MRNGGLRLKPLPHSFRYESIISFIFHHEKIDILNFITDFRKTPNSVKTYAQLINHLGVDNETALQQMLSELQQARVIRETEQNGEKSYVVISR